MMLRQESNFDRQRIIYFDFLRILAILGVMTIHIAGQNWDSIDATSFQWQTFNFFDSVVRWSVPVFVMISGALFLGGDVNIEKIYKKNILRIITAFIFWSVLYAAISLTQGSNIKDACVQIVKGHFHMWFLYMIIGLYLIIPFVKRIIESQSLIKYFLILGLIFTFVIPQGITLLKFINEPIANVFDSISKKISFHFTLGYVFYFILGYYLSKINISKKARHIIYILSILGFATTILGNSFFATYYNETQSLYGYFTLNVMLESLGVFVFVKYNIAPINFSDKAKTIITRLSKYSFGAYLVHAMVIEQLQNLFGLHTLSFNPVLSIVVILLIVSVVSFVISWACNSIPLLKKYIV